MNRKEEILQQTWERLQTAAVDRKDPFHQIAVATSSPQGPQCRIVTLRDVDSANRTLRFHIDVRSPKFSQIQSDPQVALLLYSVEDKLQIRLDTRATLHTDDDVADQAWAGSQLLSRRCYCQTLPNGTLVDRPTASLPPDLADRQPTEEESQAGRPNFAVVLCQVHLIDWYSLAFTGHQRAIFQWQNDVWTMNWAVP